MMKALTIHQPYAELIARGEKRCENRAWSTGFRGDLAIHAGKSDKWLYGDWWAANMRGELVMGAVVAVARVVDCVHVHEIPRLATRRPEIAALVGHEHAEGPVCWVFGRVWRIEPVFCAGAQGLWSLRPDVERRVREQLKGGA